MLTSQRCDAQCTVRMMHSTLLLQYFGFGVVFVLIKCLFSSDASILFSRGKKKKNHKIKSGLTRSIPFSVYPMNPSWRICMTTQHHFPTGSSVNDASFRQAGSDPNPRTCTWTSTASTSPSVLSLSIALLNSPNAESPATPRQANTNKQ